MLLRSWLKTIFSYMSFVVILWMRIVKDVHLSRNISAFVCEFLPKLTKV